jgi:DNA-binding protein
MVSCNSNQPEIRINATKETKTNAIDTIITTKSPFAPTISSVDIQMLNVMNLAIQKE